MKKIVNVIAEGKKIYIGLEDSKRTWKICVRSDGMVISETSMEASYQVLQTYLRRHFPNCAVLVVYESGFRGFTLHDALILDRYDCHVIPAHRVTREKTNRVKCDKLDARRLSFMAETHDYKDSCWIPDKQLRYDRQISRLLIQVQKSISRRKNRIRRFLEFYGYDEGLPSGAWYDKDYKRVKDFKFPGSLQWCFDRYIKDLDRLLLEKKEIKAKLKELSKDKRYNRTFKIFTSAPGIGELTAIRLVLEWGPDLSRFDSGKSFAAYTGLTGREHSTGETIRRGRITGLGNSYVRSWLIECAWVSCRRDPVLFNKYKRVRDNSGSGKKAIVAVARTLAVRLRAMAISDEEYKISKAA